MQRVWKGRSDDQHNESHWSKPHDRHFNSLQWLWKNPNNKTWIECAQTKTSFSDNTSQQDAEHIFWSVSEINIMPNTSWNDMGLSSYSLKEVAMQCTKLDIWKVSHYSWAFEDFSEEHLFRWRVSGFMAAAKSRLQKQSPSCISTSISPLQCIEHHLLKEDRSPLQCICWLHIALRPSLPPFGFCSAEYQV